MSKILVAYVSKTGTTKEVAEEIGRILEEKGLEADVMEIPRVQGFEGYSGAVIGSPINGMRWLPEAN